MPYNSMISRTDAAGLLPDGEVREIFKELAQTSAVMRFARRLPNMAAGTERMPVMSALPTAYFVDEAPSSPESGSYKQTAEAAWVNKYLYAGEIACIVPVPQSVIDDATYDIWAELRPSIVESMGAVFDAAVLYGTNKPSNWPTAIVTAAAAAGNSIAEGSGADLYDDIMGENGLISLVEQDGFFPTAYLGALEMRGKLRGLRDTTTGLPIFKSSMQAGSQYELDGAPIDFPLNGGINPASSLLIAGAWNKLVYALRQDVQYKILTESVITDPSNSNAIIYNLAQQDMVAMRVTMRIAWQIPNASNRVQSVEANRYPFSVLTPAASA